MPSPEYYLRQAGLFAKLALLSRDPAIVACYQAMALEHLTKAGQGTIELKASEFGDADWGEKPDG